MIRLSSFVVALACATVAGGCSSPERQIDRGPRDSVWQDTGTPQPPVGIDRLARYYVDENGELWDDHGRKVKGAP